MGLWTEPFLMLSFAPSCFAFVMTRIYPPHVRVVSAIVPTFVVQMVFWEGS